MARDNWHGFQPTKLRCHPSQVHWPPLRNIHHLIDLIWLAIVWLMVEWARSSVNESSSFANFFLMKRLSNPLVCILLIPKPCIQLHFLPFIFNGLEWKCWSLCGSASLPRRLLSAFSNGQKSHHGFSKRRGSFVVTRLPSMSFSWWEKGGSGAFHYGPSLQKYPNSGENVVFWTWWTTWASWRDDQL